MRNRIYELALISPTPIELDADYTNGRKPTKEDSESVIKCAPLLRTCHIIRAEASDMYYGMNIFYSNSVSKMMYWIQNLTSDKQAMLKDVCSATRVLPCTDKGKLPCLLFDLALTELRLERTECQVGKDVCHIYADKYSLGESFTRSEIVASMDEEQKDMFRSHVEGGAIEADFWPMRSLLHVVCGGE